MNKLFTFFCCLAFVICIPERVNAQSRRAPRNYDLTREHLEDVQEYKLKLAVVAKGSKLNRGQAKSVLRTIERDFDKHVTQDDTLDEKWGHLIDQNEELDTMEQVKNHVRECFVCGEGQREAIVGTGIQPTQVTVPFTQVFLPGPRGYQPYNVDRMGYLRLVYPNGFVEPTPRGQLVRVGNSWYATDGMQWIPIQSTRR